MRMAYAVVMASGGHLRRRTRQAQPASLGVLDLEIPLRWTRVNVVRDVHDRRRDIHHDGAVLAAQLAEQELRTLLGDRAYRTERHDEVLDLPDLGAHVFSLHRRSVGAVGAHSRDLLRELGVELPRTDGAPVPRHGRP